MSKTISFSWSCSMTDRQRADGFLCRSMQCDRCKEFRENKDQAIIDMHLKEMEGREPQGLEKTAPDTYLKLKAQIRALQKGNELLRECVDFYADGVNNWETSATLQWSCILPDDVEHIDDSGFRLRGGKRARECKAKIDRLLGGEK